MRPLIATGIVAMALSTSGCAYLTTYTSSVDLKDKSYVMDVKQRVVFSQKLPSGDASAPSHVVVCAEPSPDALTVIGVSAGLSLSGAATDTTGNAGAALSENGAFVGLRTHSIQLLRDAMYRLCEGYASGAVSAATFQSMQRRYQSTMMGLIAIEQLTGPVVAAQAALTTNASALAGAPSGDSGVSQAQTRVDEKAQGLLNAQAKAADEDAKVETANKKLEGVQKQLAAERAKPAPVATTLSDLAGQEESAKQELATARRDRDAAQRALKVAEEGSRAAIDDLRAARSRVSASASGTGKLGDVAGAISASNETLTKGVVDIVREINISYLRDSCVSFSADLLRDPGLMRTLQGLRTDDTEKTVSPTPMVQNLITTCTQILRDDGARLTRNVAAQGAASSPPARP
jgi:hypothetical protein